GHPAEPGADRTIEVELLGPGSHCRGIARRRGQRGRAQPRSRDVRFEADQEWPGKQPVVADLHAAGDAGRTQRAGLAGGRVDGAERTHRKALKTGPANIGLSKAHIVSRAADVAADVKAFPVEAPDERALGDRIWRKIGRTHGSRHRDCRDCHARNNKLLHMGTRGLSDVLTRRHRIDVPFAPQIFERAAAGTRPDDESALPINNSYWLRYCCRNTITHPRLMTVPVAPTIPLPHSFTPFPVKSPAGSWGPATPFTGR